MLSSAHSLQNVRIDTPERVRRMLQARSIAFVGGASVTPALNYLRDLGFSGDLAVVNAKRPGVAGIPAVREVDDLPFVPDVAFVAINRQAAADVIRRLVKNGAGAIVCNSAGFAEAGPEGARLQQQVVSAADGAVLIGPNSRRPKSRRQGFLNDRCGIEPRLTG